VAAGLLTPRLSQPAVWLAAAQGGATAFGAGPAAADGGVVSVGVDDAAVVGAGVGSAVPDGANGPAAIGAGGGAGCSGRVGADSADGAAAVGAGGADGGVNDGAAASEETFFPREADCSGMTDCCRSLKRGSSRVATSSRPSDITKTDGATQLTLILTARSSRV
jgi:hypothetical protein